MLYPLITYMYSILITISFALKRPSGRIYHGFFLANSTLNIFAKKEQVQYYKIEESMVSNAGIERVGIYLQRLFLVCLIPKIYLALFISSTSIPEEKFVAKRLCFQCLKQQGILSQSKLLSLNLPKLCLNQPMS